jgi:hypothetical protein
MVTGTHLSWKVNELVKFIVLNVHGGNNVRLTAVHRVEPLIHEPSASEDEITTEI